MLPPVCRFEPGCSTYAFRSLKKHGFIVGTALAAGRLLRCHPWGGEGYDPVPERISSLRNVFSRHRKKRESGDAP